MGPGDLDAVLKSVSGFDDARVLVGVLEGDDAGIMRLDAKRALIHTVDVITPIVDDPKSFGAIALANSVSDVYAMGGEVLSAVCFLGVPRALPRNVVRTIMKGAQSLMAKAGGAIVGGHTVKDKELKMGFAVTGVVHPKRMITVANGRVGQRLVLTKALGTGVLYQAMKCGVQTKRELSAMVRSMTTLNRRARDAMVEAGVRCATDVTGFGLAGHALNIARHSDVDVVLDHSTLPALQGVMKHLDADIFPAATDTNLAGYGRDLVVDKRVPVSFRRLTADPQTSGGMLIATPKGRAEALARALRGQVVGEIAAKSAKKPRVRLI